MTSAEYQQLVAFLTQQFTGVDHRFIEIDRRFTGVDHRFIEMGRRFAEADRRADETRQEMLDHCDEVYRRFDRLEQEYQAITQALRRIEGR